jgi:hypothetical protein
LKALENYVEKLSNRGEDGRTTPVDSTSEIFDDILKDPDMQDLEPTSPLRDYEPIDSEQRALDTTPSENQSIEINFVEPEPETDHMPVTTFEPEAVSAETSHEMLVVSEIPNVEIAPAEDSNESPTDPSLLSLPLLRQHVVGMHLFSCLQDSECDR